MYVFLWFHQNWNTYKVLVLGRRLISGNVQYLPSFPLSSIMSGNSAPYNTLFILKLTYNKYNYLLISRTTGLVRSSPMPRPITSPRLSPRLPTLVILKHLKIYIHQTVKLLVA